jgi:hypothetical protein
MKFSLIKKVSHLLTLTFCSLSFVTVANAAPNGIMIRHNNSGKCLNIAPNYIDGRELTLYPCNSSDPDMKFSALWGSNNSLFPLTTQLKKDGVNRCLNAYYINTAAPINIFSCEPQNTAIKNLQGFFFASNATINLLQLNPNGSSGNSGYCLEPEFGNGINGYFDGMKVKLYPCTYQNGQSNPNQRFSKY